MIGSRLQIKENFETIQCGCDWFWIILEKREKNSCRSSYIPPPHLGHSCSENNKLSSDGWGKTECLSEIRLFANKTSLCLSQAMTMFNSVLILALISHWLSDWVFDIVKAINEKKLVWVCRTSSFIIITSLWPYRNNKGKPVITTSLYPKAPPVVLSGQFTK